MAHLLVFCEARADFELVAALVDRVLREEGPTWIRDLFDGGPDAVEHVRTWVPDPPHPFFDLHRNRDYVAKRKVRVPHGHFNGKPGEDGALMAYTAFLVARELALGGTPVDAVLLVWDMDSTFRHRDPRARARREAPAVRA